MFLQDGVIYIKSNNQFIPTTSDPSLVKCGDSCKSKESGCETCTFWFGEVSNEDLIAVLNSKSITHLVEKSTGDRYYLNRQSNQFDKVFVCVKGSSDAKCKHDIVDMSEIIVRLRRGDFRVEHDKNYEMTIDMLKDVIKEGRVLKIKLYNPNIDYIEVEIKSGLYASVNSFKGDAFHAPTGYSYRDARSLARMLVMAYDLDYFIVKRLREEILNGKNV